MTILLLTNKLTKFEVPCFNDSKDMTGANNAKFCMQVEYLSSASLSMTDCALMGVVRVTCRFFPIISLELVKLGTSNVVC